MPAEAEPVVRFPSPLSELSTRYEPPKLPKWVDLPDDALRSEIVRRNGNFQVMLTFLRLLPACTVVLDGTGRVIFINQFTERYWKTYMWDVLGKNLCQIMHFTEAETLRNRQERERVLKQSHPEVFTEHFHNGGQRISILFAPFPDDNDDYLLFALILPHAPVERGGF